MGEFARLSGVIFEPGKAFQDISTHTRWWPPVAIIIVLSLVFVYAFSQRVGFERSIRQQLESSPRTQNMDAAQREQAVAMGMKFAPALAYAGSILATPISLLVVAGVFLLIFRSFLGAEITFRQVFAVCCYSFIPFIFATIMGFAVMMLKDPEQFDVQNASPSNIGAFLDATTTPKWLYSLATSIDAFTLWVLALLATGLSVASRKISWSTSFTWVVGTWAIWVLLKMGYHAMFG